VSSNTEGRISNAEGKIAAGLARFDADEIGRFTRVFEELFNRGDFVAMAAFYADDARLMGQNIPVVHGRQALERFWEEACRRGGVQDRRISVSYIDSSGDLGYVLGAVVLKVQSAPEQVTTIRVNFTTVWKRGMDGLWRLVVDISSRESAT
jgi:ketosteroid isomerase-like protein